ncbi:MAG TPA: thiol reductant ABC exporter subunit CydD [Acetobacteraceae bacterium]|jgi:ATP-binding cassette subfamily C protein CydD|nr:thiol reductant ABC exporter subunit CydD [Acetobacteraceae bacterium]
MAETDNGKRAARAWTREQTRLGTRAARPVIAFGLLGTLLAIGQAWCMAAVLAAALAGHGGVPAPLAVFAVLALARAALGYLSELAAAKAGASARRRLRSDALTRLLGAGPALLRTRHSGDLASIVVDRIEALDGLFSRWVPASTLAIAGPALVVLAALWADKLAALVLVLCGLLVPVAMALAGIGAAAASRGQFLALTRLQARFLDRVRGIATIVLAGRAEDEAQALAAAAAELGARTMRVLRVAFLSSAALDLAMVSALALLAVHYGIALRAGAFVQATLPQNGGARPDMALFALLLVPEFFAPLRAFSAAYQDRLHATGAADALIDLPSPQMSAAPAPRAIRTVAASGVTVAFEDVHLTWDPARGPALDGLSFRVPAGETLVLAGPSGAGKSTVIEILLGFVRPDRGRVTINGADIAELVPQALSRLTAWIGQRPVLFAGSIRDNIMFARPDATADELAAAVRAARVDEFAAALPDGLATRVGEGGYGLSGGQAQRVAIARAFLKNAPLLLLDEPTAYLDPATESEVLDGLRRLAIGRTVVMAAHSTAAQSVRGQRVDIRDGRAVRARGVA